MSAPGASPAVGDPQRTNPKVWEVYVDAVMEQVAAGNRPIDGARAEIFHVFSQLAPDAATQEAARALIRRFAIHHNSGNPMFKPGVQAAATQKSAVKQS